MTTPYFALDLAIGLSLPLYLHHRHRSTSEGAIILRLFWLGVAVGLTWEVPIFLSAILADNPIITFVREPPLHPIVFMVVHAFWDGGILLVGLGLARAVAARSATSRRAVELVVFVAWGQLTELAVEFSSVLNDAWVYSDDRAWNPVLFSVQGHPITLVPQLIWVAAPIVYYLAAQPLLREPAAH